MILGYVLTSEVAKFTAWLTGLLTAGLIVRCIRDLIEAYGDPEIGIKAAMKKLKRRFFAVVVGILATSLISLFKRYYM